MIVAATQRGYQPKEVLMLKWKPLTNAAVITALAAVYTVLAAPVKWH
jgi:hypothetical protein